MRIDDLIQELLHIQNGCGNIKVQIQNTPEKPDDPIVNYEEFFVVPEEYEEEGWVLNIRSWPY